MKPRVAVISYNRNKYSETFISNQVKHLNAQVFYLGGGEIPELDNEGNPFLASGKLRELKYAIERTLTGQSQRQQHLAAIEAYFKKHNIQAVLANFAITAFPIMDICRSNNIPLIVHFHGWTAYRSTVLEQYKALYPILFDTASAIIGVSKDMLVQLEKLGAPSSKLHHLVCGYDEDIFTYSDHSNNSPTFLSVGRFCDTKNPHLTILAFNKTLEKTPNARLVMAGGDESLLSACEALIKALKLEDKIEMRGVLSPQQVFAEMQKARALVLSSATTNLGEKEGTPVTVLEAMACGLPVLATKHAGISDVIISGQTGLLVDEFDVDAMANNMVAIAQSNTLSFSLGKAASETASKLYTVKLYGQELSRIIENCIK